MLTVPTPARTAPLALDFDFAFLSLCRLGLASSSMPKLTSVKPAHNTATHNPGGTKRHHWPTNRAWSSCAQYNITPQLLLDTLPSPRNSRATSASTVYTKVVTKLEATSAISFGMISLKMMRHVLSPVDRALTTKSRSLSDSV